MIVVMKKDATAAEIGGVIARVQEMGLTPHPIYGETHTVVAVVGETAAVDPSLFQAMPGVDAVNRIGQPFKLASRLS
ncbi:MAG: 3-deoxy-7-phosphoheptulonate synthase, partial [Caldilineales bacterium]|nr:3-deoxy-7-phosphoheptulonate synthase [Caldilineales bacterium]